MMPKAKNTVFMVSEKTASKLVGLDGWCYTFFDIWAMSTRT